MSITDGSDLIEPAYYGAHGPPHETWTKLRRSSPVHRCEPPGYDAFWAITKHADICRIGRDPDTFLSYPGITIQPQSRVIDREGGIGAMRTIIEMDPPQHRGYRKVASPYFTPRALRHVDAIVKESARDLVDDLARGNGECDFATDVAVRHPLRVLSTILGVPREKEMRILELTNQIFAVDDAELGLPREDREQAIVKLGLDFYNLFEPIIADRRANPRDDLASLLANGRVDGEPMGMMETLGYYLITFTAGHDTTKNALAGGMHQLLQNPGELEKLRHKPELVPSAAEEVVRWTPLLCLGQPRRGRLRRPLRVSRRPLPESSRGLRPRRALLPGCPPGASLPGGALGRAGEADRIRRACGRGTVDRVELRGGPEAPPHALSRAGGPVSPCSLSDRRQLRYRPAHGAAQSGSIGAGAPRSAR
jgi:cytochrome P450